MAENPARDHTGLYGAGVGVAPYPGGHSLSPYSEFGIIRTSQARCAGGHLDCGGEFLFRSATICGKKTVQGPPCLVGRMTLRKGEIRHGYGAFEEHPETTPSRCKNRRKVDQKPEAPQQEIEQKDVPGRRDGGGSTGRPALASHSDTHRPPCDPARVSCARVLSAQVALGRRDTARDNGGRRRSSARRSHL